MKKLLLVMLLSATLFSCSSDNDFAKGEKILKAQGYTNIKNTGHSFFCCGEGDSFSTGFTAISPKGDEIKGCFCSSILKGVTVRFE